MAWVFEGTLLPDGEPGRVRLGEGDDEPLPGRYALTGLVDAHCHLTVADDGPYLDGALAVPRLADLAAEGVAAVRDVGGDRHITLDLARGTVAGRPTVLAAGRFLAPPGRYFPRLHVPVPAEELVTAIEAEVDAGARWVKIVADFPAVAADGSMDRATNAPSYDEATLVAAVAAAHARGARVAAHCNDPHVAMLVRIGVDSIEHGMAMTEDVLRELGARGGAWTPTLGASVGALRHDGQRDLADQVAGIYRELLPVAVAAGVTVLAGTDVVCRLHQEVRLLAELGLTAGQALAAASTAARDFLGVAPGDDLVTFDLDPREDPTVLAAPAAVVLGGLRVS
jgi:imidazolonepropionase-like amidohydrolase